MGTPLPLTATGKITFYVTPTLARVEAWELWSMTQENQFCVNSQVNYPRKYSQHWFTGNFTKSNLSTKHSKPKEKNFGESTFM